MIDTVLTVHIKTDKKNENVDFRYKRKDKVEITDINEKLLVMYAEGIVRNMIEKGMIAPKMTERKEDGETVAE